ncbi:MAG TPA: ketoacyl-ACP synthase III [Puia sp.]|jgi:3-oxoacyl-[acyl-carrier-protein] synthase-3
MRRSVITGTGCYIPEILKKNSEFSENTFYTEEGGLMDKPSSIIVEKFSKITGIEERRYAAPGITASDMAAKAAHLAILDSGIDPESIDQVILAHNFGDVPLDTIQSDLVPALASRVKQQLNIANPNCIPYDLIFGCPGWLQGLIQADAFCKAGLARTCLVIGTETLSRVIDKHDRDSMIFSDGAGACILQYIDTDPRNTGILSANTRSDCREETSYIHFDRSYHPEANEDERYIKMKGRKVYEYALRYVPEAMKDCLDKSGYTIRDVAMIFIHQANEKMDEAIVKAFFKLYDVSDPPHDVMPMCIQWLGNSSVATIPTLFDLVRKGGLPGHQLKTGDLLLFASVGAGMNINAVCYRYE